MRGLTPPPRQGGGDRERPDGRTPMATATQAEKQEPPLTAGTDRALLPQPCVLVIFGAAGDLSWRKLLPALYNLNLDGVLPANFAVVGFGIGSQGDPDQWLRARAKDGIEH